MSGGDSQRIYKKKVLVELEVDSGVVHTGHMFVGQTQRLSDLMNDDRIFLPFEHMDGSIMIVRKQSMRRLSPLDKIVANVDSEDPHQMLGVLRTATDAELREAFHRRVQENHPDRLASLALPPEFMRFAQERMARINAAYATIKRARTEAKAAANGHGDGGNRL